MVPAGRLHLDYFKPACVHLRRRSRHVVRHQRHVTSRGGIKAQYSYTPFGERTKIAGTGPEADFGFAGMYHHERSGLNLTLFRAYNPGLGRWLSRDPLGESAGTNLYAYIGNDPVNMADPLGLAPFAMLDPGGGTTMSNQQAIQLADGLFTARPDPRAANLNLLTAEGFRYAQSGLPSNVFVLIAHGEHGEFVTSLINGEHMSAAEVAAKIRATPGFDNASMVFAGACWTGSPSSKGNLPASELAKALGMPVMGIDGQYWPGTGPKAASGRPGEYVLFGPGGEQVKRYGLKR